MERPGVLELGPGRGALAIHLERPEEAASAVQLLGLEAPRPTLVVVGGAGGVDDADLAALVPGAECLVRAAAAAGAAIVDGGTDVGVMRILGRAHAAAGSDTPLVGVVVRALAGLPGEPAVAPASALEPHHSHFVLVPGSSWGDEAPWLSRIAGVLAGSCPSVTVLLNGGDLVLTDVAESLAAGRRVLTVAGTGRAADALVAAHDGFPGNAQEEALVRSGLVEVVSLREDARPSLAERVEEILGSS